MEEKQTIGTRNSKPETRAGKVVSVNTSDKKGVCKEPVESITLKIDYGVEGDAHGGGQRQLSLLELEQTGQIEGFKPGMFGENITVSGVGLSALEVGARVAIKDAVIELSEKGKVCPRKCSIYYKLGDCIMPKAGLFFKVIEGGKVHQGDKVEII